MYTFAARQAEPGSPSPLTRTWHGTSTYLAELARGDLGTFTQFQRTRSVAGVLGPAFVNSMGLMAAALALAALIGLLLGALLALSKRRSIRFPLLSLTAIGISVPSFLAVVLLQQFGLQFNTALGRTLISMGGFAWSLEKMLLPVLVLAARPIAYVTRIVYLSLREVMEADYIRTAYAKGLSQLHVLLGHALRNLAIPYLSALGVSFRFSLSTLILVEFLFAWPGIGRALFSAVQEGHVALVVALTLAIALTVQTINFCLDVAYRLIDPRTRERL
jgi:ABC-type dipeptide/oligopeptide/nickel transport system permease component